MAIMRMLTHRERSQPAAPAGSTVEPRAGSAALADMAAASIVPAAAPAAEDTEVSARLRFAIAAPVAVFGSWAVIAALHKFDSANLPVALKVNGDASTFALLYIAAQAIERVLEPFSHLFLKTDAVKKELDQTVALALQTEKRTDGEAAAKKQDALDRRRGERALVLWAVATILGIVASAVTGLYFVNMILAKYSTFSPFLDVLVTGLVIGGGSKPLHDLIARLEKSKQQTEDPPETNPKK